MTLNNLLPGKLDADRLAATLNAAAANMGTSLQAVREAQQASIPAQRFGTAQGFGAICAFLCSVHAAYITGQNMLVDGGSYPGTF